MSNSNKELRVTKIEKFSEYYKFHCDVYYTGGMVYDEFMSKGFIYLINPESFHPTKSMSIYSTKANPTYEV